MSPGRLKKGLAAAFAALAFLYIGDLIVVRARMALRGDGEPFDAVTVNVYYAVPEKANRMDFSPGAPETVECVRALFPHFGDAPCWRARRTKTKRVDL